MKTLIYTVQAGDSLSLISKKLYGDFSMTDNLATINKISNPNLIHPGQQLIVPEPPGTIDVQATEVDSTTNMATSSPQSGWKTKVGKWFPWVVVAAAAGLLYYESNKQKKKNKTLSGSPESLAKIKAILKLKQKRNRLPKESKKRQAIQAEIDEMQKEYDLMTA